MHVLKVLNLSYSRIRVLPVSLSNLENLHALLLSHCWNLVQTPSLERLTKLKYLDFSFSRGLTELPRGMEQLTDLGHLDFSFTSVQNLPAGLISKFLKNYKFKELKLVVGFSGCVLELSEKTSLAIDRGYKLGNVSDAEITALIPRNVEELIISHFYGVKCLSLYLLDAMYLKRCQLKCCPEMEAIVESEENNFPRLETMNQHDFPRLRSISGKVVRPGTLMNLKRIEVSSCGSLKCLFPRQLMDEPKSLKEITIIDCFFMEEIIEGERNTNVEDNSHAVKVILPKLQRLELYDLRSLESINNGDIQHNYLLKLKNERADPYKLGPYGPSS
ncbi:probable disease resistance protein At4g27220 [Prosopis cineraria]|uniref:probable disease resistance protein At4g27220 n=1 Tax=Prosopis cineraria TaxID=364024 RepID=UPI00240F14E0|nr:probable disease resistance protein At4g27220 [Prosopis cineraria]